MITDSARAATMILKRLPRLDPDQRVDDLYDENLERVMSSSMFAAALTRLEAEGKLMMDGNGEYHLARRQPGRNPPPSPAESRPPPPPNPPPAPEQPEPGQEHEETAPDREAESDPHDHTDTQEAPEFPENEPMSKTYPGENQVARAMARLAEGPATNDEIREAAGCTTSSVSPLITGLKKSGLIENVSRGVWRKAGADPAAPPSNGASPPKKTTKKRKAKKRAKKVAAKSPAPAPTPSGKGYRWIQAIEVGDNGHKVTEISALDDCETCIATLQKLEEFFTPDIADQLYDARKFIEATHAADR